MKKYNTNYQDGLHTVKVTLQKDEYSGSFVMEIGGNCTGSMVIESAFEPEGYDIPLNECGFEILDGHNFKMELTDPENDVLRIEDTLSDFGEYIVAVEILDFVEVE